MEISEQQQYMTILIATVTTCLVAATPMVCTRLYVHLFVTRLPRWDDGALLMSWLGFIAYNTGLLVALSYAFSTATEDEMIQWNKIIWIMEMLYLVIMFLVKLSVLTLYDRIFVPQNGKKTWVYYTIIGFIAFNAIYYLACLVGVAMSCTPTTRIWDKRVPGTCYSVYSLFIATGVMNVFSDSFMVIIPVAVILHLQMPRKRKIEILFVFAFGLICVAAAISRLVYSIIGLKAPNQYIALMDIGIWAMGEITACMITACVPMVPLMVRRCKGASARSKSYSGPSRDSVERRKPRKSTYDMSWLRTTLASPGNDEEDPYCLVARDLSDRHDSEITQATLDATAHVNESDIVVSTTVDISSVHNIHFDKVGDR